MIKLYFGNTLSIISTILVVLFILIFVFVSTRQSSISHWGLLVLLILILGLSMSIISGVRDGIGTPNSMISSQHIVMTVLSVLGGLAFLIGLIALFYRKQEFWQIGFYMLSAIIIIKVIVTEGFRIIHYLFK